MLVGFSKVGRYRLPPTVWDRGCPDTVCPPQRGCPPQGGTEGLVPHRVAQRVDQMIGSASGSSPSTDWFQSSDQWPFGRSGGRLIISILLMLLYSIQQQQFWQKIKQYLVLGGLWINGGNGKFYCLSMLWNVYVYVCVCVFGGGAQSHPITFMISVYWVFIDAAHQNVAPSYCGSLVVMWLDVMIYNAGYISLVGSEGRSHLKFDTQTTAQQ